jgi:hypothetical protein
MKLHDQAKHYKDKATFLELEVRELLAYVNSDKFMYDDKVNTRDIQLRINESLLQLYREYQS